MKISSRIIRLAVIAIIPLLMASCDSVEKSIIQLDELVTDAESNGDDYTNEDWEDFVCEYESELESISERSDELTSDDYRQLGKITARYQKVLLSLTSQALKYGIEAGSNYMEGYMEEMGDGEDLDRLAEDFEDAMEETIDEINANYDDIK